MAGAREVVACITSAVTSAAADIAVSKLVDKLNIHMPVAEKLQRLEMLLIRIHSAVEAAEKHNIKNTWLLQWRDKLKEAVSGGDEVLASFRQRAMDVSNGDQQQDAASSSSSSSTAASKGVLYFVTNALSGAVQGVRSASKMFPSSNGDMKVLSNAVKNLEELSPHIGEFLRLLQVEISSNAEQTPTESAEKTTIKTEKTNIKTKSFKRVATGSKRAQTPIRTFGWNSGPKLAKCVTATVVTRARRGELLSSKLKKAVAKISKAVEQADSRDLRDREWLASWADILRDAKKQGYAVLEAINASTVVDAKASEDPTVQFDEENDELGRFMCSIKSLVSEVTYFGRLVCMCPSR